MSITRLALAVNGRHGFVQETWPRAQIQVPLIKRPR